MPGVGDVKDAYEAITGVDPISGERLSWAERAITVAAAVIRQPDPSALPGWRFANILVVYPRRRVRLPGT